MRLAYRFVCARPVRAGHSARLRLHELVVSASPTAGALTLVAVGPQLTVPAKPRSPT
jgi:hypothetical protein